MIPRRRGAGEDLARQAIDRQFLELRAGADDMRGPVLGAEVDAVAVHHGRGPERAVEALLPEYLPGGQLAADADTIVADRPHQGVMYQRRRHVGGIAALVPEGVRSR